MNCTLCQTPLINRIDNEYFKCTCCRAYVKDKTSYFTEDQEKKHYEQHNNDVNDLGYQNFTAPITNYILNHCDSNMLGLDFGCGKGPVITKQLLEKGFQIKLYDPYFYPQLDYIKYRYDFIFSCEVFEHFYNPFEEVSKLSALLKKGGILLVMTHVYKNQSDFSTWYYRKDQTHVFIYTPETMNHIASQFGYQIECESERLYVLKKM